MASTTEQKRAWAHRNPEKLRAKQRAYRKAHPEKARALTRASHRRRRLRGVPTWRATNEANRERARELERLRKQRADVKRQRADFEQARRARKLGQFVEHVSRDVVFQRDAGLCGICGDPVAFEDFHVDHIAPLRHGGEHSYANVQLTHPFCNMSKGARLPEALAA